MTVSDWTKHFSAQFQHFDDRDFLQDVDCYFKCENRTKQRFGIRDATWSKGVALIIEEIDCSRL